MDDALEQAAAAGWQPDVSDIVRTGHGADRLTFSVAYCGTRLRYELLCDAAAMQRDAALPPDIVGLHDDGTDAVLTAAAAYSGRAGLAGLAEANAAADAGRTFTMMSMAAVPALAQWPQMPHPLFAVLAQARA